MRILRWRMVREILAAGGAANWIEADAHASGLTAEAFAAGVAQKPMPEWTFDIREKHAGFKGCLLVMPPQKGR